MFFMSSFTFRPQWMPIPLFLAVLAAALFLVCRIAGPLSLGLLASYCAPVGLVVLAFLSSEGLIGPKLEPLFAVLAGALTSYAAMFIVDWLRKNASARRAGHET
jgi:hypothetical protein